jgi:predicted NAD-dependent protein-ADP-ribosyltransferase YbiA (DUF1768 family)
MYLALAQLLLRHSYLNLQKSDVDDFWGIGKDGKGRNELGKALERLRTQLRSLGHEPRVQSLPLLIL